MGLVVTKQHFSNKPVSGDWISATERSWRVFPLKLTCAGNRDMVVHRKHQHPESLFPWQLPEKHTKSELPLPETCSSVPTSWPLSGICHPLNLMHLRDLKVQYPIFWLWPSSLLVLPLLQSSLPLDLTSDWLLLSSLHFPTHFLS